VCSSIKAGKIGLMLPFPHRMAATSHLRSRPSKPMSGYSKISDCLVEHTDPGIPVPKEAKAEHAKLQ
jgi:hypothetical protein